MTGTGWWARVRRLLAPPRRLKVTREGKYFLGITFAVGLAAINTGNNLLYLVFGLMLSLIIVSGVMSESSLRSLTVIRRLPGRAQVARPHLVEIEVFNHKRKSPSYAIEVEDLREGHPADKRCFFLKISPDSAQVAAYRRTPTRRGLDRHIGFRVATRFPFGLFEKSRELRATEDLLVYPAVHAVRLPTHRAGPDRAELGALGVGHGDEILGARPMRESDDPRDIYWRKSTIAAAPVVKERARETRREVVLLLDSLAPSDTPEDTWLASFEDRVSDIASRAVAHLRRGDAVLLRTTAGDELYCAATRGADAALRFLALVRHTARPKSSVPEGAAAPEVAA